MRVGVQSGVLAQQALDTFPTPWPVDLLIERFRKGVTGADGDALVNEIADRLAAAGRSDVYVELGNELNGVEDPKEMNAWYKRSIQRLDGIVALDHIITCGIANIEPKSLLWLQTSIAGLPLEVLIGWHAYDQWLQNREAFVALLEGRLCAMTEWGSFNLKPDEEAAAARITSDLAKIYEMPCVMAPWYASHSGTAPNQDFGLYNQFTHEWRLLAEQALKDSYKAA
jgi:hypothetical protein